MRTRRAFISMLGGAAAAWPVAARAQQPAMPVIGFLDTAAGPAEIALRVEAFRRGLNETGFVEGQNVALEFRWTEGQPDRAPPLAADLIRRRVAVIVTQNLTTPAAKAATEKAKIPIVFVIGGDPVASGLVTSVSRPEGNITGVSWSGGLLMAKRLELLHELVPKPALIGVLLNTSSPGFEAELQSVEAAARGVERETLNLNAASDLEINSAFSKYVHSGIGALLVGSGAFFARRRRRIAALSLRHALPTCFNHREAVMVGGLMSYGASDTDAYRRAGIYVGRILKGAKPSDLPVEMPSRFELVINLATANALGLDISPKLLSLADDVIE